MKTFSAKSEDIERQWWLIDAAERPVGAVATEAAALLRGKAKPLFTSHVDCGDFVVVINAEKAVFTGKKEDQKIYHRFSGYVGGHHSETPKTLREKFPERILEKAILGMIPHTRLGRATGKKLKVIVGSEHPHEAQNPQPYVAPEKFVRPSEAKAQGAA